MRNLFILTLAAVLLSSCEKELDIDYHEIDPLPVIEGILSSNRTEVKFTQTRNMDDSVKTPGMECEYVRILDNSGELCQLQFGSDGIYRPASSIDVVPGQQYTLEVKRDGRIYTAQSTASEPVKISEPQFVWAETMDWMQFWEFSLQGVPDGIENFIRIDIFRNGKIYGWYVISGKGDFPVDMSLYYDSDWENNEDAIIYDGDNMRLEVSAIDRDTYYYLYGLLIDNMNPAPVFKCSDPEVTCLGYFSAVKDILVYETVYVKTQHP